MSPTVLAAIIAASAAVGASAVTLAGVSLSMRNGRKLAMEQHEHDRQMAADAYMREQGTRRDALSFEAYVEFLGEADRLINVYMKGNPVKEDAASLAELFAGVLSTSQRARLLAPFEVVQALDLFVARLIRMSEDLKSEAMRDRLGEARLAVINAIRRHAGMSDLPARTNPSAPPGERSS